MKIEEENNRKEEEEKRIKEKKEKEEREIKNLLPYRIDYFSFPSSRPITSIKCFCPHCAEIPNISLGYKNESGNYVKCDQCRYCYCCSNPKIKTLDDYISLMVKVHKDYFCEVHDKKEEKQKGYFSCELCQKWMCEKCINEDIKKNKEHYYYIIRIPYEENIHTNCAKHNFKEYEYFIADEDFMCGYHICEDCEFDDENNYGNDIYHLNKELGVCYVNQVKDLIEIGVVYLDDYCKKLYDRLIKSIGKDENLINKAKELYKKFIIRNRRVLFFYQMSINTATPSCTNYVLIKNISKLLYTKFDRVNVSEGNNMFNQDEIKKVLDFFENNYIVGINKKKIEDVNDFIITEISKIEKDPNKIILNDKEEDKYNRRFIGMILLNEKNVCTCSENGYIYIFHIKNNNFEGEHLLSLKAHEENVIGLDKIKDKSLKFITCDKKSIKIWNYSLDNNNKVKEIQCETTLEQKIPIKLIYVLNYSKNISFVDENDCVIILNQYYETFCQLIYRNRNLKTLYQIDSKDNNDKIFIIGERDNIFFWDLIEKPKRRGTIECDCIPGNSIYYWKNDILLVGGFSQLSIININSLKYEYIIKCGECEFNCFFHFNDGILCGYCNTSQSSSFSYGIAEDKFTQFFFLKKGNNGKYEYYLIEDKFHDKGITNALWIDKDIFISSFHFDDILKVFKLKLKK